MTTDEKLALAIDLIRRSVPAVSKLAADIASSRTQVAGKTLAEHKLEWAERELEHVYKLVGELAPDPDYWRDAYRLDGTHAILTEEGWEPAELYPDRSEVEILDEVNAPAVS